VLSNRLSCVAIGLPFGADHELLDADVGCP